MNNKYPSLQLASIPDMQLKSSATEVGQLDTSSLLKKQSGKATPNAGLQGGTAAVAAGANEVAAQADPEGTDTGTGAATGAMSGAATGFAVGGPWGAAAGAVIGGIAGGLSAKSKRKAAERQANADMYMAKGAIQQRQGETQSNILSGLANNLSNTLV